MLLSLWWEIPVPPSSDTAIPIVKGYAGGDPDIYILSNLNNVGSVEVNAFQVNSRVVLQKSIREGFGLTVTEALWKGRPTIAGNVGDENTLAYVIDLFSGRTAQ